MNMPIGNMPAAPASTKSITGTHGTKDQSHKESGFGELLRMPARSKGTPPKSGPAGETAGLRTFQPAGKLVNADASATDKTDDIALEPGDTQEPAMAVKDGTTLPPASGEAPAPADAGLMHPATATNDDPPREMNERTTRAAPMAPAMPQWGDDAPTAGDADSPAGKAAPTSATVEMPGARLAAERPQFIQLDNLVRQGGDAVADLKNALHIGADSPAASPADEAGKGFESIRTGRVTEWKSERVTIVAQQNIPAPVAQPAASTTSSLVAMLSGDAGWREAAATSFQPLAGRPPLSSAHSLKLQLHPAELGMVTASLRLSGEHLTVELRVENREAFQRLNADSEIIVKSMRALGLDIDKVTVQPPQLQSAAQMRADPSAPASPVASRGQDLSGQASSGGSAGQGGQQSGRSGNENSRGTGNGSAAASDRTGGDLYI